MTSNEVHTYLWNESQASRGPEEIASCLMDYFEHYAPDRPKAIMYSDQCGGQNKNIKVVAAMNHMVKSDQFRVTQIDQKVLIPGHTYLPCDQDFGLIERRKSFTK